MSDFTLKTDPAVFQDVLDGKKTFEIRFNDRGYQVGDLIVLKETKFTGQQMREGSPLIYTGREMQKQISYILSGYGLQDGWVILGITDFDNQQAKIEKLENELSTTKQVLGNVIDMEVAKVDNLKAQLNSMEQCYIEIKQEHNELIAFNTGIDRKQKVAEKTAEKYKLKVSMIADLLRDCSDQDMTLKAIKTVIDRVGES